MGIRPVIIFIILPNKVDLLVSGKHDIIIKLYQNSSMHVIHLFGKGQQKRRIYFLAKCTAPFSSLTQGVYSIIIFPLDLQNKQKAIDSKLTILIDAAVTFSSINRQKHMHSAPTKYTKNDKNCTLPQRLGRYKSLLTRLGVNSSF